MGSDLLDMYEQAYNQQSKCNMSQGLLQDLLSVVYQSYEQERYSEPMPLIGVYIALASLVCVAAICADIFNACMVKKTWIPCKYFSLNAASLTVIAVAIKLPMDLNNPMPGDIDQITKLGSMAVMCIMMAILLPFLGTMKNKELVSNIIALVVLVITFVVNVIIQIKTGVVSDHVGDQSQLSRLHVSGYANRNIAIIYVAMLLMLLMIHICSALMILTTKHILESKYQSAHEITINDLALGQQGILTVEKLKQHVRIHWIMAEAVSPQFIIAFSPMGSASAVICIAICLIHIVSASFHREDLADYKSDYKWSILVILAIQTGGVILGATGLISSCLLSLITLKPSITWFRNNMKVFKVESYWTQKLSDWKRSRIPLFSSRRFRFLIQVPILNCLILFQKAIVIVCKILGIIVVLPSIFVYMMKFIPSIRVRPQQRVDLRQYSLHLRDDMELSEITVRYMSISVNRLIKKYEKQQYSKNLKNLLEKSTAFEGIGTFDSHRVPPLVPEPLNCWSLALVTLTTIAVSLPQIPKNLVHTLMDGVSEGLVYVTIIEESLNSTDELVSVQKAAEMLWEEVQFSHKWLEKKLRNPVSHTTAQIIVESYMTRATNIVNGRKV